MIIIYLLFETGIFVYKEFDKAYTEFMNPKLADFSELTLPDKKKQLFNGKPCYLQWANFLILYSL